MEQKLNHKDEEAREEKTRKAMQYNVTMCSVHVSGNGNNNAFCVYC
jgi:hypothetical protein